MEARQDIVLVGHVRFDDSPPAAKAALHLLIPSLSVRMQVVN